MDDVWGSPKIARLGKSDSHLHQGNWFCRGMQSFPSLAIIRLSSMTQLSSFHDFDWKTFEVNLVLAPQSLQNSWKFQYLTMRITVQREWTDDWRRSQKKKYENSSQSKWPFPQHVMDRVVFCSQLDKKTLARVHGLTQQYCQCNAISICGTRRWYLYNTIVLVCTKLLLAVLMSNCTYSILWM